MDEKKGPVGMPKKASCAGFVCTQQGSECVIWNSHPVCKCRDRCEGEPHFTCASDGMTYYNKCYMDAEACSKGITLSVVKCPSLAEPTTFHPTTVPIQLTIPPPTEPQPPVMVSSPSHQTINAGNTASFLCDVTGQPPPNITWEKQLPGGEEKEVVRPNQVRGNMVVTNIGQLVIYNAQPKDSGIYTCTAQNPSGSVTAHHPLTVLQTELVGTSGPKNLTFCSPEECIKLSDSPDDCGSEKVSWYFESKINNCLALNHCQSNFHNRPPAKVFDTYEDCMQCCGLELSGPCGLPTLQGPCKVYEPRWAYSTTFQECQTFIYGGCGGNDNNFNSKETCEETCPFPKNHPCKACKPRGKMVTSFCQSDFVILGHMSELTKEEDSGHALVTVEEILKDEKMGLRFFGKDPLEVTFLNMDWNCPCPNITSAAAEGQVIVMGNANDGMAVLQPESYVGASSPRRVRKLKELISKNTCDVLKDITNSP